MREYAGWWWRLGAVGVTMLGCLTILALSLTPAMAALDESLVLVAPFVSAAATLWARWLARGHRCETDHLPRWATAVAYVLLFPLAARCLLSLVGLTDGIDYTFGSGRDKLVAFAPWWAFGGVYISYLGVCALWNVARHPAEPATGDAG